MHDALRNPLVIEMEDLLAKNEVFKQHRPARARLQLILIIRNRNALICRQCVNSASRPSDAVHRPRLSFQATHCVRRCGHWLNVTSTLLTRAIFRPCDFLRSAVLVTNAAW